MATNDVLLQWRNSQGIEEALAFSDVPGSNQSAIYFIPLPELRRDWSKNSPMS